MAFWFLDRNLGTSSDFMALSKQEKAICHFKSQIGSHFGNWNIQPEKQPQYHLLNGLIVSVVGWPVTARKREPGPSTLFSAWYLSLFQFSKCIFLTLAWRLGERGIVSQVCTIFYWYWVQLCNRKNQVSNNSSRVHFRAFFSPVTWLPLVPGQITPSQAWFQNPLSEQGQISSRPLVLWNVTRILAQSAFLPHWNPHLQRNLETTFGDKAG